MDENETTWLGSSIEEIYENLEPWQYHTPPVSASKYHTVLYELPVVQGQPPKPHYSRQNDWDCDHVRLPYSPKNLFPTKNEDGEDVLKPRWELVQTALLRDFASSRELEAAVNQYNNRCPTFSALHYLFEEVLEEEETQHFFKEILPGVINLALQLPDIVPCSIPLLKSGTARTLSLSQLQIACLLANAFLCTFPWRKDIAASYPGINFFRLFAAQHRQNAVAEKLKCICHYFRRVLDKPPSGVVTFERKHLYKNDIPRWDQLDTVLEKTKIHVNSKGTIESDGLGMLQIDFANKYVGGGVLGSGCVQEEIRFIICPELIVSRLFVEQLGDNEALLCIGAERYSNYDGYGDTFTWTGNHLDSTPFDSSSRRRTTLVAIDATHFSKSSYQYNCSAILRELNKAYAGFYARNAVVLSPVATGNWGCGAFRGDARLKSLVQLMACNAAGRHMVYFTFEDTQLRDDLFNMYKFLCDNHVTVSQLWKYLCQFSKASKEPKQLYSYIEQAHCNTKKQLSIKSFFGGGTNNKNSATSSTSSDSVQETKAEEEKMEIDFSDDDSDIIESSQLEENSKIAQQQQQRQRKDNGNLLPNNHETIMEIMKAIDGDIECSTAAADVKITSKRKETVITIEDETVNDSKEREKSASKVAKTGCSKIKITDYFSKIDKPQ